jgi:hypothetical protein
VSAQNTHNGNGIDNLCPAGHAFQVTPSDTEELAYVSLRLFIGTAGDVTLRTLCGDLVTYRSVPAGTYLQVRANQIHATGTTVTNIVAEY